jgi:hypothetical protein
MGFPASALGFLSLSAGLLDERSVVYSGTPLIRTPLGPSTSGRIIEVSSFQTLLKYGGCGLPLQLMM